MEHGSAVLKRSAPTLPVILVGTSALIPFSDSRLFQIAWLFFKTGLLSFGGAYASLVFVQRGAVAQYHWLSDGQLLDGVALSVATPGPFMLFTTFVGYIAGGIPGAALATFFVFLPSFVFCSVACTTSKKSAKTADFSIPRRGQRRSSRRNRSCIAGSDPRSVN